MYNETEVVFMKQKYAGTALRVLGIAANLTAMGDVGTEVKTPYVLGFTFQGGYSLGNLMPEENLKVFNEGAFDGWALIYIWNYDRQRGKPPEAYAENIAWLKKRLAPGKHIWPAVSICRVIQPTRKYIPETTRFHEIPGMDLENEAGVREMFEQEWRNACLIAKELGSPGILLDPEWYGNSEVRFPKELAKLRNEDVATTLAKCRAFGSRLADITEKVFPDCHVFTMYTGFYERPDIWTSIAHIHLGMIQRAKELGSRQMLIDGGELGLGYLATSFPAFQERIYNRWMETRDLLRQYPNYELGGVLAPYVNRNVRSSWATDHRIGDEQDAEDFVPHFRELFRNYRFTWIYGTCQEGAVGFNPWGAGHSAVMSAAIDRARRTTHHSPPDLGRLPADKVPEGDRGWTAERVSRLPREILVDWANPGDKKIVNKYYKGQGAVPETATISPGPISARGRQWAASIEFDRSGLDREQRKWPGSGVSVTNLLPEDFGDNNVVWTEVFNAGDKPLEVRLAIFLPGEDARVAESYDGYAVGRNITPGESRILYCEDVNEPIEAVSVATAYQASDRMSIYVSPVYLTRAELP
jgi:hypothetical protein